MRRRPLTFSQRMQLETEIVELYHRLRVAAQAGPGPGQPAASRPAGGLSSRPAGLSRSVYGDYSLLQPRFEPGDRQAVNGEEHAVSALRTLNAVANLLGDLGRAGGGGRRMLS